MLPLAGTPRLIVLGREVQTTLEQDVLNKHLRDRGYKSLAHAVESNDQEGSFNAKPLLQRLCNWAVALEKENLVKLSTYQKKTTREVSNELLDALTDA